MTALLANVFVWVLIGAVWCAFSVAFGLFVTRLFWGWQR